MANTLRFKRGLASGIPTALAGEPLFTTDTFDLYIGNGTTNTRFQKYIASGATTQILRGDGSLYTFPLAISSPSAGQVLKYNGTSWVNDSDSGITGSGTTNYLPKFTSATTLGNSNVINDGNGNFGFGAVTAPQNYSGYTNIEIGNTNGGVIRLRSTGGTGLFEMATTPSATYIKNIAALPLWFGVNNTEYARIHSTGNFGIGTGATDSGQRLQVVGTGYFSDSVGIGSTSLTGFSLLINHAITTGAAVAAASVRSTIQSQVTTEWNSYQSLVGTQAATFTLGSLRHFAAQQSSLGASSVVTNQYGFIAASSLTGATNNYGFYGDIAAATGRWNLYMNGTANNYMAGSLGIGTTSGLTDVNLKIGKVVGGSVFPISVYASGTVSSAATTGAVYFQTDAVTENAVFTLPNLYHFRANQQTFGASSTVTNQYGFFADNSLSGATNDFGFYGNLAAATGRWNFYANGTALNYFNGNTLIGSTTDSGEKLQVTGTMKVTGATSIDGTTFNVDATNNRVGIGTATPSDALHIFGANQFLRFQNTGTTGTGLYFSSGIGDAYIVQAGASNAVVTGSVAGSIVYRTATKSQLWSVDSGTSAAMTLDASGNLGLGVTPSAWSGGGAALQLSNGASLWTLNNQNLMLSQNSYFNGSSNLYIATAPASQYQQSSGTHIWRIAPSGTAGNAITFTQAMTLDASGNLGVGTTTFTDKLTVAGSIAFNLLTTTDVYKFFSGGSGLVYSGTTTNSAVAFIQNGAERMRLTATNGNLHIGTFTADSGERLQVTGTAKITGASSFGGNMTLALNQNAGSILKVQNTTAGTGSYSELILQSDATAGSASFGKVSSSYTPYKILTASSTYIYNGTAGDIAFLNDVASGTIKFAAGASSTAQMTLTSGGLLMLGSTTSSGERLQVTGTAKITGYTAFGGNLGGANQRVANFRNSGGNAFIELQSSGSGAVALWAASANEFGIYQNATAGTIGTSVLYINSSGNTGLGTFTPDARLRVAGTVNGTQAIFSNVDGRGLQISTSVISGTNEAGVVLNARSSVTSGTFIFQTDGTQRVQIDSSGLAIYGGNALEFINSAANTVSAIRPTGGGTSIMSTNSNGLHIAVGTEAAGDLILASNNTERVRLSSQGWFSHINATNPSSSVTDSYVQYSADVVAGNAAPHFRTENGAVIKLYQETTSVGNSIFSQGGGNSVLDDSTFDGYTLRQIVKALRNQGILQ